MENVYFTNCLQRREIEEIRDRYNVTRIAVDEIIEKKTVRVEGSSPRELFMTNLRKTSYRFAPEFIVRRTLRNKKLTPGVRDEYRYQISKEVSAKTLDGTLTAEEIPRFCMFHPLVTLATPNMASRVMFLPAKFSRSAIPPLFISAVIRPF